MNKKIDAVLTHRSPGEVFIRRKSNSYWNVCALMMKKR